jgi:hypothetical protein
LLGIESDIVGGQASTLAENGTSAVFVAFAKRAAAKLPIPFRLLKKQKVEPLAEQRVSRA